MDASTAPARLAFGGGLLVTLALIGLGAVWPSLFSIFALMVLPAPVIFLAGIFKPGLITDHPKLRAYLWICVALAVASWVTEITWLATQWR